MGLLAVTLGSAAVAALGLIALGTIFPANLSGGPDVGLSILDTSDVAETQALPRPMSGPVLDAARTHRRHTHGRHYGRRPTTGGYYRSAVSGVL